MVIKKNMKKIKIDISKELWDYVKSNEGKVLCLWPKHLKDEFIQILRNDRCNTQWVVASGAELLYWSIPHYPAVNGWEAYRFHPDVEPIAEKFAIRYIVVDKDLSKSGCLSCYSEEFEDFLCLNKSTSFYTTRKEARNIITNYKAYNDASANINVFKVKANTWNNTLVEVLKINP